MPADQLAPYVESIFSLLNVISNDQNRSDALMRSAMGVIGQVLSSACLKETH